jgi:hypothetical protein
MAQDNNNNKTNGEGSELQSRQDQSSIGNMQGTTQTGAQNNGGQNIPDRDDEYTESLQESGDRNSSNRKEES